MRKAALIRGGIIMGLRDMSCCFTQDPMWPGRHGCDRGTSSKLSSLLSVERPRDCLRFGAFHQRDVGGRVTVLERWRGAHRLVALVRLDRLGHGGVERSLRLAHG